MCAVLVPLVTTLGNGTAGALGCPAPGGTVSLSNGICAAAFSAYDANDNPVMTTQSFIVPAGITSLSVVVDGGFGGLADVGPGLPAYGGQESGTITVKPGATLTLVAGTNGVEAGLQASNETGSGWPDGGNSSPGGGGGGGGSYVYDSSGNLLLAAGGGGGAGDGWDEGVGGPGGNGGGAGGGAAGQVGAPNAITSGGDADATGAGGGGATVSGGGSGGGNSSDCPAGGVGDNGPDGQTGEGPAPSPFVRTPDGGDGGYPTPVDPTTGFGTSCLQTGAGGGGGGYYGGGGGGAGWQTGAGGGGGSGYAANTVSKSQSGVSSLTGVASEGGAIFISFPLPGTPIVESLTTTQGPVVGGEAVTINGSGFTGATAVNFVGAGGTTTVTLPTPSTSDTSITVNAPNLSQQMNAAKVNTNYTVDVEVVTPGGTSQASPPGDSYTAMVPIVTAVNTTVNGSPTGPAAGPVKGTETVTLTGQWLNGADSVSLQPTQNISFVSASPVGVSGDGTVASFTAPDATSEYNAYTSGGGTGDLLTDLIVDIPVQNSATSSVITSSSVAQGANDKFYLVPVAVTDLSEHSAVVTGGTFVTITGVDLTGGTVVLAPSGTGGCASGVNTVVTPETGGTATSLSFTAPEMTPTMGKTQANVVCDVEVQVPVPELPGVTLTSAPNPGNPGDTLTYNAPVVQKLSSQTGLVSGGQQITITGLGFTGATQVEWAFTGFATLPPTATPISVTDTAITVDVPSAVAEEAVLPTPLPPADVRVQIPDTAGGFITSGVNQPADQYNYVIPGSTPPSCTNLNNCNTATSTGSAPAVATSTDTNGSITVTGSGGAGSVRVGQYGSNPVGTPSFSTGGTFFDAAVGSGSAFTSVTLQDCDLGGGTSLQWWNPVANSGAGAWQPVTPTTGPTNTSPPCVTATLSSTSSPTLAQLSGTVFVAEVPTVTGVAPTFTTDTPPLTATVGTSYSYTFIATGTPAPTYALNTAAPTWLTINSTTGAVSGTPPTGTTSFAYSVTASNGNLPNATTGLFTVAVSTASTAPAFTADTPPLAAAPGALYSYQFVATGTPAPTYSLGTAVTWLSINSATGLVSGTVPSTYTGTFLYSVKATNSVNSATAGPFTVTVSTVSAAPVFIADTPPLTTTVGAPYTYTFQATGAPTPTYALASGAPIWLSINATTGVLSGTVRSGTASFSYSVTAKNTISSVTAGPFKVAVSSRTAAPSFTAAAPPLIATAGSNYSYTFQASGTPIPTYSLVSGAPTWLSINSTTGVLSGTVPTGTTTFTYSVKATNSVSSVTAGPFKVSVSTGTRSADTISLTLTGGVRYTDSGGSTSGSIIISPHSTAPLTSIVGTATFPGARGGSVTVTFNLWRFFGSIYVGTVRIVDPGAGVNLTTPVLTASLRRTGVASATGTVNWFVFSGRRSPPVGYTLTFALTDTSGTS
jgi:hypothetical protein